MPQNYSNFDGWALGAMISFPNISGAPDNGFCFAKTDICTLGYYSKTGPRIYTENLREFGGVDAKKPNH